MMLTSGDQPEDSRRCQKLGVAEYAIKPVARQELLGLILKSLGKSAKEERPASFRALPVVQEPLAVASLRILLAEDWCPRRIAPEPKPLHIGRLHLPAPALGAGS
jgi:hypothetical protein